MNREEVIAIRQRLLRRGYQPIGVYNWNCPDIPEKDRGKRPNELNWQTTVGMPIYRDLCREHRHSDRETSIRLTSMSKTRRSSRNRHDGRETFRQDFCSRPTEFGALPSALPV